MSENYIRPVKKEDREWICNLIQKEWGSRIVVSRGAIHYPDSLPGFIAEEDGTRQGLITFSINGESCEIISLNSLSEGRGIGASLIDAVRREASEAGCKRIWLITTNDNLKAIKFYQRHGFILAALYRNAVEESRRLKPEIPLVGADGIPIRDEVEIELML